MIRFPNQTPPKNDEKTSLKYEPTSRIHQQSRKLNKDFFLSPLRKKDQRGYCVRGAVDGWHLI